MENYNQIEDSGDQIDNNSTRKFIELSPYLYDCCLEYLRRRKCSEKTKLLYTKELESIFKRQILTQQFYNSIYSKGNYYKSVLKLITKTCEHFDIPSYRYKTIKPITKPRHNPQVWSEENIIRIASNIEDYGLLVECAYYIGAGLRFSSALFLNWDKFMWEDWLLDRTKVGKCDIFGKGDKDKILLVDPILMNKLYNLAQNRGKLFQGIPYKNSIENKYLFINQSEIDELEEKYRKQNFDNVLDSKKEEINVKGRATLEIIRKHHYLVAYKLKKLSKLFNGQRIKFHSIRHSRATNLLKKGVKLLTIMKQLMHNSIATTQIYLNLEDSDVEKEFNDKL